MLSYAGNLWYQFKMGSFDTAMAVKSLELEKNGYPSTIRKQDVLPINGRADVQPEMLRWSKN
ncbi:hypothetical protein N7516_004948 [Penicillium verrucosum]|uniref:uncharacterized protein n=1 Tax=Penicillium verrucosum TaxID=60171 RepID=UPI002544EE44|nr:uncharacterized protein N7516_004948 [Penicillium verrucosum]KAJ5944780.1 hypothetical protein N7516_004948 [Penicillium verrucosum]